MSSGFKLMLRPPPHVEFLQGYPGIAPHGERKAALVQGTLEVRGDVKAKWVRVELRKIEVLPGGGQNNTFTETIGERPITLWTSPQEEFSELKSNDFPFHIAVPEAVPPSIALERGAAIKYELIASVMLKGKKSLWKRDPAPISTYSSPIVIEKHDLLQCWPIYHQQQTRQASANGVTLIANFPQTGFGPGDVVPVEAILRADVPGTGAVLRAYELTVRETLIFRSSPPSVPQHNHPHLHMHSQQPQRRVPAAQTRSNIISDQKVPVPVQVFPGSQHRCDLGCQIPLAQTNVSVRTARHIEVNYIVQVKAVLASNAVVSVELPVTITNWQRQASQDAMHRIGYAPELSGPAPPVPGPGLNLNLFQATNPAASPAPTQNGRPTSSGAGSHSIPERVSRRSTGVESPGRNTLGAPGAGMGEQIDELGYVPAHAQQAQTMPGRTPASGYGSSQGGSAQGGRRPGSSSGPSEPDDFGSPGPLANNGPALRPPNPNRRSAVQRFTVVNADQEEGSKPLSAEEEKRLLKEKYANQDRKRRESDTGGSKPAANGNANGNGRGAWPSAEDEKQRLYDSARRTATKTQQSAGHEVELPESAGGSSSTAPQRWPTAEEEKRRLFDGARQAAARTQGTTYETSLPYAQDEPEVEQDKKDKKDKKETFAGGWAFSAGGPAAAPYGDNKSAVPYASSPPAEQGYPPAEPKTEARPAPQQWLSAADEKRMLFEKARAAAERTQSLAVNSMEGNGNTSSSSAPYSTPSPYGTNSTTPYSTNSTIPSQYGGSNSAFPDRVSSPISTLSHGHGVGTPGAGKTGEELFAAGLAAMGRQSMYPTQSPASSYLGAHAQATPPPRVPSPPSNAVPGYGSSSSAPGYGSGSSLSHSQSMRYPSAAEEKASLAYMAAKQRVEQAHAQAGSYGSDNGYADGPSSPNSIPGYDTLYGPAPTAPAPEPVQAPAVRPLSVQRRTPSASGSPPAIHSTPPAFNAADLPPGFTPNPGPTASALSALEEKARLRRQYEDQDAAAAGSTLSPTAGPPPRASPPPPAFQPSPTYGTSAQDEKERMRRMYAEQDAAVRTNERRATNDSGRRPTLPTPPRAGSLLPSPGYETNGNEPPPFAGGFINPATFKPLSAAEEKARLRAQYEAETNGTAYNPGQGSSFDPPPPSFDSHYPPPERQNTYVPPDRNGTTTPGEGRGLQRDPSVSWGKRPATQTPVPEAQLSRAPSTFVAPPPPPPLMPKPPAAYIQETLAANQHNDWDRSRSPTPDLYDEPLRSPPLPGPNAPAVPAKPIE